MDTNDCVNILQKETEFYPRITQKIDSIQSEITQGIQKKIELEKESFMAFKLHDNKNME